MSQFLKPGMNVQLTPSLKYLTQSQMEDIHLATLEILATTGVYIDNEEALKLLKDAGAIIKGKIVKYPEYLVKQALATAPSRVVMANRHGERVMFLEGRRNYYGTGSGNPYTIDLYTGEWRDACKQDVINGAIVNDYLPNIDYLMPMVLAYHEIPDMGYIHEYDALLRHSTKPLIVSCGSGQNCRDIIEMAETVIGGPEALRESPILGIYSECTSPLQHVNDALEKTLVCAENWVPVIHTVGQIQGANSPSTIAGTLIQANAEILSVLVIHQLKQPGAPAFYGGTISAMNMKTMAYQQGNPEYQLCCALLAEIGTDYYKLPVFNTGGGTDAKIFDAQAAAEGAYSLLMTSLAGGNLIHDIGYTDGGLVGSIPMVVFCDEMIGMIKPLVDGVPWTEEDLAVDAIKRVGPGGNYLKDRHTLNNYKKLHQTDMFERRLYNAWVKDGSKTLEQKVQERTIWILENHKPEPLEPKILAKLDELMVKYEKNYRKALNAE